MQYIEKFVEIDAPVERVFDLFSNFENFPRWMRNIKDVHYSGRHYTRWTAVAPLGSEVEWEAETTLFKPDHKIAWRSVRGDVDTEGEVIFEETARGTTRMHVVLGYDPPAGRLGAMVASLFGTDPEEQLEDDLERFAAVAEGRRPVRPSRDDGGRGRDEDRSRRRGQAPPRSAQRGYEPDAYDARRDEERRAARRGPRDEERDSIERIREMERRRRFEEELRAARRSQLEGGRRYHDEREREEQLRYRAERDEQLRRADERERRELGPGYRRERVSDEEPFERDERPPRRYALTPRERARERREQREPDYGYTEKAFSRGVDKLLDDAPSSRWRR